MAKKPSKLEKFVDHIQWRDIYVESKLTHYQISDIGLVKNNLTNKLLEGSHDSRGYKIVSIYANGKMYSIKVHRLVAQAFIPNPDNKPTVNHRDGNKDNNKVSNLEWATHKENIDHAIETGLRNLRGTNASSNIYSEEVVHKVCELFEKGMTCKNISKILNVNINLPRRILYANKWKHISSQYKLPKVDFNNQPKNILRSLEAKKIIDHP